MLFLICMVLNICHFIQRTEHVPVELDISAIEEYILLLLYELVIHIYQNFFCGGTVFGHNLHLTDGVVY